MQVFMRVAAKDSAHEFAYVKASKRRSTKKHKHYPDSKFQSCAYLLRYADCQKGHNKPGCKQRRSVAKTPEGAKERSMPEFFVTLVRRHYRRYGGHVIRFQRKG